MSEQGKNESGFEVRLEAVKLLPFKTDEQKTTKWEAARDLRIETMLVQAHLAWKLVLAVNMSPEIGLDQLEKISEPFLEKFSHPEVIEGFLKYFESSRDNIGRVLNHFRKEASLSKLEKPTEGYEWKNEYEREEVGEKVYRSLTGQKPNAVIRLNISPFAIAIETSDSKDFERLDKRTNIGGFFENSRLIEVERKSVAGNLRYNLAICPLIVTKGSNEIVKKHEIGHAINRIIIEGLSKMQDKSTKNQVWGGVSELTLPMILINNEKFLYSYMKETVLPYALSTAKDELLADLVATHNFDHLANLTKEDGIYDYFNIAFNGLLLNGFLDLSDLQIEEVKHKLWNSYVLELEAATQAAQQLFGRYKRFGITDRVKTFPYMLAQIPLIEWKKRIEKYFEAEILSYRNAEDRALVAISANPELRAQFEKNSRVEDLPRIYKAKKEEFKNPGTKSIYAIARELDEKTDKVISQLRNTSSSGIK